MLNDFLNGYLSVQPFMDAPADTGSSSASAGSEPTSGTEPVNTETQGVGTQPDNTVSEIEVDGLGKVKVDDLKEWRLGYMRQQDYTRKTQEIAKQRNEAKQALDLFNYLRNNPQVAQAMANGDFSAVQGNPAFNGMNPIASQIADVNMKVATMELDNTITQLKSKYSDFDEVAVLTVADRRGLTDLEFVYKAIRGERANPQELENKLRKQIESEITEKIRKNGLGTETIIAGNDTAAQTNYGLTPEEIKIALKMGMTPERYAKGKTR
jgi:hypothetical protein